MQTGSAVKYIPPKKIIMKNRIYRRYDEPNKFAANPFEINIEL